MENFKEYQDHINELRTKLANLQASLYQELSRCTCDVKASKANCGPGSRFNKPTKTTFDECVVCMKLHNVKTLVNGEFVERRRKS
jgi:hypothetical protein